MLKLIRTTKDHMNSLLITAFLALPASCNAATLEGVINNGVRFLQGPLARAVGGAVVIGAGYMCFRAQKLPTERFVQIVVGLGLIYGGPVLYGQLIG